MATPPKSQLKSLSRQARIVLDFLVTGKGLSNIIAISTLGVGSLSSRISELTKRGYAIDKSSRKSPNGKRFTVYKLVGSVARPPA